MSLALNKTGRPIVYSCEWPFYLRPMQQVGNVSQGSQCAKWEEQKSIRTA